MGQPWAEGERERHTGARGRAGGARGARAAMGAGARAAAAAAAPGPAPAALVTGAARGIGRAAAEALAARGLAGGGLTLVDLDGGGAGAAALALRRGSAGAGAAGPAGPAAVTALESDVSRPGAMRAAVAAHLREFGRLDVVVLNAGVGEALGPGGFLAPGEEGWRRVLATNLDAMVEGAQEAARAMQGRPGGGAIVLVASIGGVFPMPQSPAYAASKAGALHFARSLAGALARKGVRVNAVCPAFTDTKLVRDGVALSEAFAREVRSVSRGVLLRPEFVGEVVARVAADASLSGEAVVLDTGPGGEPRAMLLGEPRLAPFFGWRASTDAAPGTAGRPGGHRGPPPPTAPLPASFLKVRVARLSEDFAAATEVVSAPMPGAIPPGHVLMRRLYAGVNASDINFTSGRYFGGAKAASARLPFDAGFEAVGVVAAVGEGCRGLSVGAPVAVMEFGAFSEYGIVEARKAIPLPAPTPEAVALLTSGLTASIALEVGDLRPGKTVLVTAAAGGTGQFAVQLAKLAGCRVVATCGTPEKAEMLRGLGADRVVDYKREDLGAVLGAEFRDALDLVYDGVGGAMFDAAVKNLAPKGRVLVIGMIGQYAKGWPASVVKGLPERLLWKSATVQGFFLLHYVRRFRKHLRRLVGLQRQGLLKVMVDPAEFVGVRSVAEAVQHLHSGMSRGKVVVRITPPTGPARL